MVNKIIFKINKNCKYLGISITKVYKTFWIYNLQKICWQTWKKIEKTWNTMIMDKKT